MHRGYELFDPAFRVLFNSYYHGVGERHPRAERGMLSRPSLDQVLAYRRWVDAAMLDLLDGNGLAPELQAMVELGLNHEQQHQELILTDVKHMLSRNPLEPVYRQQWPLTPIRPASVRWLSFEGGLCDIGRPADIGFCFDNETPRHRVWLEPYQLASHPVTHGDFQTFIEDGGYRRPELWLSAGWDTVVARGWQAPLYWQRADDGAMAFLHAARSGADRPARADLPCELLRGRRLCPMGRRAVAVGS